jgi:lycopene beta-cyclase
VTRPLDIVIVGAGVSAMLLARSLIRRGCFRTLTIIGKIGPLRAHRFAYWGERGDTPFDGFADACWSKVRVVRSDGIEVAAPLERFRYRTFPTRTWFEELTRDVLSTPGVERIDARVDSVTHSDDRAVAHVREHGFEGAWLFTSARLNRTAPSCWQRFEGWEVAVDGANPLDGAATLMDFRTPALGDFRFMYALPLSPERLFVEHVSYQPSRHERHLTAYLNDRIGEGRWEVVDREQGATPLYLDPPHADGRVVGIGVAGGLAKVATGYALMRMWRDAERIAEGLEEHGRPALRSRTRGLYRLADRFFIEMLRSAPQRLPELLAELFANASGDDVLAFLDDRATLGEQARVSRAMPAWLRWWAGPGSRRFSRPNRPPPK